MKLKYSEVKPLRERLLVEQNQCCRLCGQQIDGDAVLDHDHASGLIRGVLHRGCNALLGKIENNMPRNKINIERLSAFADNLIEYLVATPVSEFLHPTYKIKEPKMGRGRGRGKKPPKR